MTDTQMRGIRTVSFRELARVGGEVQDWREWEIVGFEVVRRVEHPGAVHLVLTCEASDESKLPKIQYSIPIRDVNAFINDLDRAHDAILPPPPERIIELLESIEAKMEAEEADP